jgi:multiple sugar transport system substrate-binding protein
MYHILLQEGFGMKKLIGCLLVVVMVSSMGLMAFAEDIELRIAWWGSQNRHDRTIKVIEMFMEEHPNIKISYEPSGWNDHWTKMSTQAAGGNLPDIMQQDFARLEEWVEKGMLLPLDEFAEAGVLDFSNVSEGNLAGGMIDGKLYGVNLGTNSECFVLDADAFAKAGIELPAQDWSLEDFEKIVLEIHEKLGIWGMGDGIDNEQRWKSNLLSRGMWAYSDDGKALGYTDEEEHAEYIKMLLRLQEAGAIPTRAEEVAEFDGQGVEAKAIVSQRSAMEYFWSNQIVAVWNAAGEDRNLVMVHPPRPKGGSAANYVKPSMFFSITSHAKHPKEAAMFIDYFTNSVEANKVLMAERGVPISSVVAEGLADLLTPSQLQMFQYLGRVEKDSSPLPPPDPIKHAEVINDVYWPEFMDPILYGQISVEDGIARFRELASEILAED